MKPVRDIQLLVAACLWPVRSFADRYGIQEAMEDGRGGDGLHYVLGGVIAGAAIGYVYSLVHNFRHEKKIAADGCIILGGMLGGLVLPFVLIAVAGR